jgi:hypothetical protein
MTNTERNQIWRDKNRVRYRTQQNAWRERNRDKNRAYQSEWQRKNRILNGGKIRQDRRERYAKNPSKELERSKKYAREHRQKCSAYSLKWWNRVKGSRLDLRIRSALQKRIWHALKGNVKSAGTVKLLGCSIENFLIYLESRFDSGMTWGNYGSKWHVDHIVPCALFDLTRTDHQRTCFHFSNLRPMWAKENISRGIKGHHQIKLTL